MPNFTGETRARSCPARYGPTRPWTNGAKPWLGQLGIVPTFRYRPVGGASPWFAELGVGASFMTSVCQNQRKRFSTRFNFADHAAFGRNFGVAGEHKLALRIEHFSNAGIKHPNPGQNFVELRYAYRFP